jgi:hypothetical protein
MQIQEKLQGWVLFIIVLFSGLFLMLYSLVHSAPWDMYSLINSDSMFFYDLYNDLFKEGGNLLGWDLNTTFTLLPNAVLFLLSLIVVNHPLWSIILHGFMQYSLMMLAAWFLLKTIRPKLDPWLIATALLLPAGFFIYSLPLGHYYLPSQFYHPYHAGAFIMTLFAAGISLRQISKATAATLTLLFMLVMFSAFSNRIFLVMFSAPFLITLMAYFLLKRENLRNILRLATLVIAGSAAGFIAFELVKNIRGLSFGMPDLFVWENIGSSFRELTAAYSLISGQKVMNLIIGLCILLMLVQIGVLVQYLRRKIKLQDNQLLFFVFSMVFVPAVILAPVLSGIFIDFSCLRYNFMVLIWLMLSLAPILNLVLKDHPRISPWIFIALFSVSLLSTVNMSSRQRLLEGVQIVGNYYHDTARLADNAAMQYELKNGIGDYWDAKVATAFSRQGLKVRQVYWNLRPYHLANSMNWYMPVNEKEQTVFNFIIDNPALRKENILETFGAEIDTFLLDGRVIYIVPDFIYQADGVPVRLPE